MEADERPPVPDPTTLTTAQLDRSAEAIRDYINGQIEVLVERLNGLDASLASRLELINHIPGTVNEKILHLREFHDEKFKSTELQFKERDTRSERESRDNKVAVDAAFAAQKEAAAKTEETFTTSINKSEKATGETLNKQADLFKSTTDALADKIDDTRAQIGELRNMINGAAQNKTGGVEAIGNQRSLVASLVGIGLFLIATVGLVITLVATNKP